MESIYIVTYLFLAGMGGGMVLLGSVSHLLLLRRLSLRAYRTARSFDSSFIVGPLLLALAAASLLLDLGRPLSAWKVVLHPLASPISFGAICLALTILTCAVIVVVRTGSRSVGKGPMRILYVVAMALSLCTVGYTGVFLYIIESVAVWHTLLLPALFIVSSLTTGAAMLELCQLVIGRQWCSNAARDVLDGTSLADLITLGLYFGWLAITNGSTFQALAVGFLSFGFWVGIIALGLVVPWTVRMGGAGGGAMEALRCGSVIAGGFALRFCVLFLAMA